MSEKLQKVLARAGLGSRREIETWIEEGRLVVNGYPALLGTRVEPKDEVKLDGRRLKLIPESLVNRKILMYHKPEGEVTTRKDPEGRPTVFDRLPPMRGSRWVAIGRLDLNTSGLLLFTNDGEVANRLMHPSHEVEREYAVRILGELKPAQRKKLLEGVVLEDGLAKFNSIESRGGGGSNRWYHVTLSEGRTREVRRMFESMDLVVSRLIRVRYGPVALDPLLKQGMNRELNLEESNRLCEAVGIEPQAPRAERRREYQQSRRSEGAPGRDAGADFDELAEAPSRAAARKPKVIGSKDDELPLDRVERAAELLRRRRAAESAGVEFSGRNRRLSGKRTLRESELRRLAEEKAAAKKQDAAASSTGVKRTGSTTATRSSAARAAEGEVPRRSRVATGSRTAASSSATKPASRSRTDAGATSRSEPRSRARYERDDDEAAPRRSTRTASRPTRIGEDDAPRRRSAAAGGARSASKTESGSAARTGSRVSARASTRTGEQQSERPARSRTSAVGERSSAGRSTSARGDARKPAARTGAAPKASATRSGKGAAAGKSSSNRSEAKSAGRTATAKPARAGARTSAPSRAGAGSSRSGSGGSRSGTSRSGSGTGKGKRTR